MRWLVRLRWIAVCGQTMVCLLAYYALGIRLPVGILVGCIGSIAVSNLLIANYLRHRDGGSVRIKALILAVDVVILTVMLFFTGGAHNPFTMFYLLHVTMAVMLLPPWGAWGTVALCTLGFWSLFYSNHPLESSLRDTCCNDMTAHLQGMVVGLVLTGCGISYFVSRLTAGLRQSRRLIAEAQSEGEHARRTMEVATLAAGIAHELATPLGTIAIVSHDLENMAGTACVNSSCKEDARLIRQEVERCRKIIEKLGHTGHTSEESLSDLDWNNLTGLLQGYLPEPIRERLETHIRPSNKRPLLPTSRLFQCLSILVKNAAEASPAGSEILLDAEIHGDSCVFRVIDRGPGFPAEIVKRIGEPLVTTKSKHGGLGLGLYLVKAFVRDFKGELEISHSTPTTVTMTLPRLEKKP